MTTILKHKEYKGLDGETYFVEQYKEKGWDATWWRYGYIKNNRAFVLSKCLWSRPNLKRLNLI